MRFSQGCNDSVWDEVVITFRIILACIYLHSARFKATLPRQLSRAEVIFVYILSHLSFHLKPYLSFIFIRFLVFGGGFVGRGFYGDGGEGGKWGGF